MDKKYPRWCESMGDAGPCTSADGRVGWVRAENVAEWKASTNSAASINSTARKEPTRLAERPAERRTLGLQTSNVNKYSKGQMVFDMGKDKMCGIVTAVEATVAGRPAGTITVAVYETKVLPVESTSQWPVGQRLEGEDSGIVAKSVPSTQGARAQFSSTQSAAMRSADPSNLVGQRLHVFDTEAGRLGTVTSVKSCKGGSSKHSIKFDEGDREPELVSLQKTKGASKGVRFRLENAAAAQAGTVTIFLD